MSRKKDWEEEDLTPEIMARREKQERIREIRKILLLIIFTVLVLAFMIVVWIGFHSDKQKLRKRGISAYKSGRYEEAVRLFDEALDEKQWGSGDLDRDCRLYKAAALFHIEKYSEAERTYKEIIRGPHDEKDEIWLQSMVRLSAAMAALDVDNPDLSVLVPTLSEAVAAGEDELGLYLGAAYQAAGDKENMYQAYAAYAEKYGMTTYIAYQLSTYDLETGNLEQAEKDIQSGFDSGDQVYASMLLYNEVVLMEKRDPDNKEAALEKMKELLDMFPDNETFKKEYDFLYNRLNTDPTPVRNPLDPEPGEDTEE